MRDLPEPAAATLDVPGTSPDTPEAAVVDALVELLATLTAEARELKQAVDALRADAPSAAQPSVPSVTAPRAVV